MQDKLKNTKTQLKLFYMKVTVQNKRKKSSTESKKTGVIRYYLLYKRNLSIQQIIINNVYKEHSPEKKMQGFSRATWLTQEYSH